MSKKCKNCGAEMPEEAHFCFSCMTACEEPEAAVNAAGAVSGANSIKDKLKNIDKKRAVALATAILIILILIALCAFYFSGKANNPSNETLSSTTEANKAVVSTVTNDDGTVVTEYDDGSVETQKPDGTKITKEANGTVVTEKPDGTVITEKPDGTVITEKPDGTTEITQKPEDATDGTSEQASESTTENTTESTTAQEEETEPTVVYDDFQFEYNSSNQLCITKYLGNAKTVKVPYSYNGEEIFEIQQKTFENNSTVEKIIFEASEDYAPGIQSYAIYKCANLKSVVFNWSDYYKRNSSYGSSTICVQFAKLCSSLKNIEINGSSYYKVYDNGLYYLNSTSKQQYTLYYFCEGADTQEYRQPSWCNRVANYIFKENPKIKTLYINPENDMLNHYESSYVQAVYIDSNNAYYFDDNGVAYSKTRKQLQFYPKNKTDKSYTILDGYDFYPHYGNSHIDVNLYLETLYIPKDCSCCLQCLKPYCTRSNLKTIYVEDGNPNIDFIKENFSGNVIVY